MSELQCDKEFERNRDAYHAGIVPNCSLSIRVNNGVIFDSIPKERKFKMSVESGRCPHPACLAARFMQSPQIQINEPPPLLCRRRLRRTKSSMRWHIRRNLRVMFAVSQKTGRTRRNGGQKTKYLQSRCNCALRISQKFLPLLWHLSFFYRRAWELHVPMNILRVRVTSVAHQVGVLRLRFASKRTTAQTAPLPHSNRLSNRSGHTVQIAQQQSAKLNREHAWQGEHSSSSVRWIIYVSAASSMDAVLSTGGGVNQSPIKWVVTTLWIITNSP